MFLTLKGQRQIIKIAIGRNQSHIGQIDGSRTVASQDRVFTPIPLLNANIMLHNICK